LPLKLQGNLAVAVVGMRLCDAPDLPVVHFMQWQVWFSLVV
jgi:hypothetical protein